MEPSCPRQFARTSLGKRTGTRSRYIEKNVLPVLAGKGCYTKIMMMNTTYYAGVSVVGKGVGRTPPPYQSKSKLTTPLIKSQVKISPSHRDQKQKASAKSSWEKFIQKLYLRLKKNLEKKIKNLNFPACSKLRNQYFY